MMKRTILILLTLIILFGTESCKKEKNDILYSREYIKPIKELRKEAISYLLTNNIPGGSFAVAKNGKVIYAEGMGLASKDFEVVATRKTKFRIGQVSQCFTSVMYQMMLADGTLHADSTVQHYMPDFPKQKYKLTLDHLVNQTSGLREPDEKEVDYRALNNSLMDGIGLFKNDSLLYPPGALQTQSMFNYNLLGAVMEKATGKSFGQLLKSYITDTLHLANTETDILYATIKGRTDFFDINFVGQSVQASSRDMRFRAPSEGLLSNAEDLVLFGNAILESKIITEEMKSDLLKPVEVTDGPPPALSKGWILMQTNDGKHLYGRTGGVTGGGAALVIFPEERLVVAATINMTDRDSDIPILLFANKFLPQLTEKKE